MMHHASNPMQEKSLRSGWSLWLRMSAPLFVVCLLLTIGLLVGQASNVQAEESGVVPDAPGSISGVVRDAANAPAANVDVQLYQRDGYGGFPYVVRMTRTAADGAYRFGLLGVGIYRVRFSDPTQQLGTVYYANALSLGEAQDISVAGNNVANIDATLPVAGAISGTIGYTPTLDSWRYVSLAIYRAANEQWDAVASAYATLTPMTPTVPYSVKGLTPGVYRVCAYDYYSGYYGGALACYDNVGAGIQYANDVTVTSGVTVTDINIQFGAATDLAAISGQVTSLQGSALPSITVELLERVSTQDYVYWMTSRITQTNASGDYIFGRLLPQSYKVRFVDHYTNYLEEYYDNVATIDAATPITIARFETRANVAASLTPGGAITGKVTVLGENDGSTAYVSAFPADNTSGYCCFYSYSSDSSGAYRIGSLPPGVYKVYATKYLGPSGFFSGYYGGSDVSEARPITVSGPVTIPNIDIDLGQGAFEAVIAGRVTNKGAPLAGIQVGIYRNNYDQQPFYYTATGADGRYSIGGLLDGFYRVGFRDPTQLYISEFYSGSQTLLGSSELFVTGARPLTDINASLYRAGGISGRVTYTDGAGAPNVYVSVLSDDYSYGYPVTQTTTAADGVYTLSNVRPGRYVIQFYDPAYPYGPYFYHQRMDYYQADRVVVGEGVTTTNIDQIIGGAPTAIDIENEPQAPASARMYLPLVTR